jgi:hypothetical protein
VLRQATQTAKDRGGAAVIPGCQKCGQVCRPDTAVLVTAAWASRVDRGQELALVVCRPCSAPVVGALKALLEKRR